MIAFARAWAFFLILAIPSIEIRAGRRSPGTLPARVRSICVAKIISTISDWPLAWCIMVFLQMHFIPGEGGIYGFFTQLGAIAFLTLQAAWLIPYEEDLY